MPKIINVVGAPVVGKDRFWDREPEIALFTRHLDDGNHVLLIAQRRMGKTSLMREVIRRLEGHCICLFVDVQKHESAPDAIAALAAATKPHAGLWRTTKDIFGSIIKAADGRIDALQIGEVTVHLRAGLAGDDWRAKGDSLFAALAGTDKPVVVFLDEMPILVNRMLKATDHDVTPNGIRAAEVFLSWLRENSLRHTGRVRVVVSGSIGLAPVLQRAGLSATANYLLPFELQPWDEETAVGFINALATSYSLVIEPGACEHMVVRVGCCIPHHIQTYFHLALSYCKRRGKQSFSIADAELVYLNDMLGPRGNMELAHYEERLYMVLGRDLGTLAVGLLTVASVEDVLTPQAAHAIAAEYLPEAGNPEDSLRVVLGVLEHDGYLRRNQEDRYSFASKLLRDWWRDRFNSPFAKGSGERVG